MKLISSPEVHFGRSVIETLPTVLRKLNINRMMLVTSGELMQAGLANKITDILDASKVQTITYSDVKSDPSIDNARQASLLARSEGVEAVVALGGGSSIDVAKVSAALATNSKPIEEYIGTDLIEHAALPLIAIPTTAGTGSEVTPIAILSDEEEQTKKGIVSSYLIPNYAFLDPTLITGLPKAITAMTGMDALCHAIEAYTSVNASDYSDTLASRAVALLYTSILEAFRNGQNLVAREKTLMGSLLAGMAFANAGVTAVHAFAYPLGGRYHVPHGLANSLMLPAVIEHNFAGCEDRFAQIYTAMTGISKIASKEDIVNCIVDLRRELQLCESLEEVGVSKDAIPEMASSVLQVTRLLANNPRIITLADAVAIYTKAYSIA